MTANFLEKIAKMPTNRRSLSMFVINSTLFCLICGTAGNSDTVLNNIAFDLPDLTATLDILNGEYQIEAYKSISNDQVLREHKATGQKMSPVTSQLFWVSVGYPTFLKTRSARNASRLFHFTNNGFFTYVQMLTASQRKLLADVASFKYHLNISDSQIVHLVLSKFECSIELYDGTSHKYLVKGKVSDFRTFPLRLDFKSPLHSIERKLLLDQIADDEEGTDLQFLCSMASTGKVIRTNTLVINTVQADQLGLKEKLFGPTVHEQNRTVYVTRDQMTSLAAEMYSALNIIEDYQIPETQFSESFVADLIDLAASRHFGHVPLDEALSSLSNYSTNIGGDLRAENFRKDMNELLKVETLNNRSRITLDEAKLEQFNEKYSLAGGGYGGMTGISVSTKWALENSMNIAEDTWTLNDQLHELNLISQNYIKWELEGTRVVPKSLNVARLSHSKLLRTLTFSRVRVQTYDAPFHREFGIYMHRSRTAEIVLERLWTNLETQTNVLFSQLNSTQTTQQRALESLNETLSQVVSAFSEQANTNDGHIKTMLLAMNHSLSDLTFTFSQQNATQTELLQQLQTLSRQTVKRCRKCSRGEIRHLGDRGSVSCAITCGPWNDAHENNWYTRTIIRREAGPCRFSDAIIDCQT